MRGLAVFGLILVALMQIVFFVTGGDRAFPYREVQAVSFIATLAMVWGTMRGVPTALAVGAGVNLVMRVLQPVLGLTRLPLWTNALLALGWAWILADAARGRAPKAGLYVLGAAHFVSALVAESRLSAFLALCMGAIGLLLAAPSLTAWPGRPEGRTG